MLNHHFLNEFSQNFIDQVQKFLNIDGYILYSIENIHQAYDYQSFNVSKTSLTEYINQNVVNDPVSFQRFYKDSNQHVALLSEHECSDRYSDFLDRWKVKDTAEIFFRKRNGDPIFGMSIVRDENGQQFTEFDKKILNSFYCLSEKYFHHHTDTVDHDDLSHSYNLTKKEIIVVEQLLSGINNNAIAKNLNCSLSTVKTHIQHIYQKINVANRQELICKFLR